MSGNIKAEEYDGSILEEIVVTATKRSTSLQDTALSISAISEESLDLIGADEFSDFAGFVPGLNLRDSGPGTSNEAGHFQSEIKLFDVERVAVLRGPQGAQYGSGSMGGTIRVITNKPDLSEFSAKIKGEYSQVAEGGNGYQLNGMIEVTLMRGFFAPERILSIKLKRRKIIDNVILYIQMFTFNLAHLPLRINKELRSLGRNKNEIYS